MKRLVLICLFFTLAIYNCKGQGNTMYPIGDYYVNTMDINNINLNIKYPGNLYLGSSLNNMLGGGSFTVTGSSQVNINAQAINLKNTHLGSTDPSFKVHAGTKSLRIASNYISTSSIPQVPLYEKIEFGIELPEDLQSQIDLFLNSNTSAANPNHPGINPYDPEDISVEAIVTGTINDSRYTINSSPPFNESLPSAVTVYGFYYQEATPTADLTGWTINNQTPYPFRIRMAPPYKGSFLVTFKVTYKTPSGYEVLDLFGAPMNNNQSPPTVGTLGFNFDGVANTSGKAIAKGYLEVGHHKRHLRHSYDKTSFFPIGMNIPQPKCSSSACDDSPLPNPQGMANRRYEFSQLNANGGNYTRILSFGDRENGTNCVEITHRRSWDAYNLIGNYQINQDKMMETDLDIETFENNNIFATWCLQTYGFDDIPNTNDYYASWSTNPYKYELNKDQVTEFFTDSDCQRFFKNRLRYIQARWGYSASIAIYQMNSEIDDFGRTKSGTPPNEEWTNPYRTNANYAQKGEQWQITMAGYLKSFYPNHLISSSYVANPTQPVTQDPNEFPIVCHDKFIYTNNCDVVSWNPYTKASPTDAAEELNRGRWNAVNEISYNSTVIEDCNPDWPRFADKPIFFSEAGMNDGFNIDPYTDIQMHNMIWATACSGMLGTGLNWQGWEAYTSGSQIEKKFQNFSALSSFFDDLDFESHKYEPSVNEEEKLIDKGGSIKVNDNMDLEIFVMANDNSGIGERSDRGFGWVHHRDANWNKKVSPRLLPDDPTTTDVNESYYVFDPITSTTLLPINNNEYNYKLNGFKPGDYFIEIYDTENGNLIISSSTNNNLIHSNLLNVLSLGLPHVTLYKNYETDYRFDYSFKFWHVSTNGNDLRVPPTVDSLSNIAYNINIAKDDGTLKKYFVANMIPNPASEIISISTYGDKINSISILDLSGKLILLESPINLSEYDVKISDLSPGAYFVNVKSYSGITKIFKLIKI